MTESAFSALRFGFFLGTQTAKKQQQEAARFQSSPAASRMRRCALLTTMPPLLEGNEANLGHLYKAAASR